MTVYLHAPRGIAPAPGSRSPQQPHREHAGSDCEAARKVTSLDLMEDMTMSSWSPNGMSDGLTMGDTEDRPQNTRTGPPRRTRSRAHCGVQSGDHSARGHCRVKGGGPGQRDFSFSPSRDRARGRVPGLGAAVHRAVPVPGHAAREPRRVSLGDGLGQLTSQPPLLGHVRPWRSI